MPMTVMEFFELSAGEWKSQRTSYQLTHGQAGGGRAQITIQTLTPKDPVVVKMCEQTQLDPALVVGGAHVQWQGQQDGDSKETRGEGIVVLLPDPEDPSRGRLLRKQNEGVAIGTYLLGTDEILILRTDYPQATTEERIWFASPNLRLRTNTITQSEGCSLASFWSEVRRLPPNTSAASSDTETKTQV